MESEKKFRYHYYGTFEVKPAEVEIVFEAEDEEGKELDLLVFDDEEWFDKRKEEYFENLDKEVKEIFDNNKNTLSGAGGTLLDKSELSSELYKSCRQAWSVHQEGVHGEVWCDGEQHKICWSGVT